MRASLHQLRIVEHFDELLERDADLDTVLRDTARLADCAVGFRSADKTIDSAIGPDGPVTGEASLGAMLTRRLPSGDEAWLARRGGTVPLDDVVLKRLAAVCSVAVRNARPRSPELGDPALVEFVVSAAAGEVERSRALKLLGYTPSTPLRVLAIAGDQQGACSIADQLGGPAGDTRLALLHRVHILTTPQEIPADLFIPIGTRVVVGQRVPAIQAPLSWRKARAVLRLTLPSTHDSPPYSVEEAAIVDVRNVGCFSLLAHRLTQEDISEAAEVSILDALAAEPGGADMLRTLEIVAATESLRKAAAMLHMHHNSVRHRVTKAEQMLGFDVTAPYGRMRLMMSLVLRRLRDSGIDP